MTETQITKIRIADLWRKYAERYWHDRLAFEKAKAESVGADTIEARRRRWALRCEAAAAANGLFLEWRAMFQVLSASGGAKPDGSELAEAIQVVSDWIADRIDADLPLTDEPSMNTPFANSVITAARRLAAFSEYPAPPAYRPNVADTMRSAINHLRDWRVDMDKLVDAS